MNRQSNLRTGYTTGACAAAAAKAATLALLCQKRIESVDLYLPAGITVTFKVERCTFAPDKATCSVIKDAGDDPDVTNGAEICATVGYKTEPGITIERGWGVGFVTKPGLGLEIGEAAINPVPRQMTREAIAEAAGKTLEEASFTVTISVPKGDEIAKKTLNSRLGIMGGISILGTTGIVVPYSADAYTASIDQALDVAVAAGLREVVLTTGRRTERYAQREVRLPEEAFVQMGDFVGYALDACASRNIRTAHMWAMIGKLVKIAAGNFQTHISKSQVDLEVLTRIARQCGADEALLERVSKANTARHALEMISEAGVEGAWDAVCRLAAEKCKEYAKCRIAVDCVMVDFNGIVLGRSQSARE